MLPVCILAGGLGTRLGIADVPKPLVEIAGAPFLVHQLRSLRRNGVTEAVICVGHLGELIEERIGAGDELGMTIRYRYDGPVLAGTAGAVRNALPLLGEAFFVLYGDTYLRIDYGAVEAAFRASEQPALMTVLRNEGRWDVSNVLLDGNRVTRYEKADPTPDMLWIDYGLSVMSPAALAVSPSPDLAEVQRLLAARGQLAGYATTERFYEIGTPAALAETEAFLYAEPAGDDGA